MGRRCIRLARTETGEGEQALDGGLCGIGEAQEQKGDEGDRDLNAHGIFRGCLPS